MVPKHIKQALELGRKVYHFAPGEAKLFIGKSGKSDKVEVQDILEEGVYHYGKSKTHRYGGPSEGEEGAAGDF